MKEQDKHRISGNTPLRLDTAGVYTVVEGCVDICLVKLEGKKLGRRMFMVHCRVQDLVVSPSGPPVPGHVLMAYGCGEACLERTEIDPLKDEKSINIWISVLAERLTETLVFPRKKTLFHGEKIQLGDRESLQASEDLQWLSLTKGKVQFMDTVSLSGEKPFPLTKQSWLTAEGEASVELASDIDFLDSVITYTEIVAIAIKSLDDMNLLRERQLYEAGRASERAALRGSLNKLGSILQSESLKVSPEYAGLPPLYAACSMVAEVMGIKMPAELPPFGPEGPELADIARQAGIRYREVVLDGTWWMVENGPLLGCLDEGDKPVALLRAAGGKYRAFDPLEGTSFAVSADSAKRLLRTAYMLYRPFPSRKLRPRDVLSFAMSHSYRDLGMLVVLGTLSGLLGLLTPIITGQLIGVYIPQASRSGILQMTFILGGAALAMAAFNVLKGIAMVRMEGRMDLNVQAAVWDRLLSLPVPFFRKYTAGDLAVRSLGFAAMRQILSGVTLNTFLTLIFSSFNLLWLFYYDWAMALVAVGLTVFAGLVTVVCGLLVVLYQKKVMEVQGRLSGMVLQFITGINKIKLTGAENRAFSVWAAEYAGQKEHAFKSGKITAILTAFNGLFPVLTMGVIFGWYFWREPAHMTVADFVAFNIAFISFMTAFLQISAVIPSTALLVPLYQRARPILETRPEFDEAKGKPGELSGSLLVNHLSFSYSPEGPMILKDVSMKAGPGEFVAVVGGSGAGKSTLLRLLLGFETPEYGDVFYGDHELKNLDVREVRRQIGVVLQNGQVMSGDIFSNIVGASNLTMDEAWEAARMVGFADEINAMPMKMNTMISAGGGTLSGGQRQRLLIARAIVRKPRILFFDEATSALDNKTQAVVSRSLEKLKVTRIVIAHRLSTIINADNIYVFDQGQIVEQGSYEDLMAKNGYFYQLAKRQLV